jgi:hypothetical protein
MTCLAPTTATCTGTQTRAKLSYDNKRQLTHWQFTPSSTTSTADERYDGAGNRVGSRREIIRDS